MPGTVARVGFNMSAVRLGIIVGVAVATILVIQAVRATGRWLGLW
ncbi:hypothetical protein [Enterovirga sp. CN4-39]